MGFEARYDPGGAISTPVREDEETEQKHGKAGSMWSWKILLASWYKRDNLLEDSIAGLAQYRTSNISTFFIPQDKPSTPAHAI